jgi:hypothetical protein
MNARHALLLAGCAAFVVALTWPQAINPLSVPDSRDSWFNMWRLAWIAHQLRADPVRLFDANIYYPERGTLAYSDAILMQGVIAAPLLWLGLPTPFVYTLLVLGSFMFAGLAACALARYLTDSLGAGIAAGIVFAFTPYRFDHYMHLELLWSGWMPLALLFIHRAWERPTPGAGAIAGLLVAAQVLSCIYYGVFFATILAVFTPLLAIGHSWASIRLRLRPMLVGAVVIVVLLLPYVQPYRQAHQAVLWSGALPNNHGGHGPPLGYRAARPFRCPRARGRGVRGFPPASPGSPALKRGPTEQAYFCARRGYSWAQSPGGLWRHYGYWHHCSCCRRSFWSSYCGRCTRGCENRSSPRGGRGPGVRRLHSLASACWRCRSRGGGRCSGVPQSLWRCSSGVFRFRFSSSAR